VGLGAHHVPGFHAVAGLDGQGRQLPLLEQAYLAGDLGELPHHRGLGQGGDQQQE
jgi:hypothetical protein